MGLTAVIYAGDDRCLALSQDGNLQTNNSKLCDVSLSTYLWLLSIESSSTISNWSASYVKNWFKHQVGWRLSLQPRQITRHKQKSGGDYHFVVFSCKDCEERLEALFHQHEVQSLSVADKLKWLNAWKHLTKHIIQPYTVFRWENFYCEDAFQQLEWLPVCRCKCIRCHQVDC